MVVNDEGGLAILNGSRVEVVLARPLESLFVIRRLELAHYIHNESEYGPKLIIVL